MKLPVVMSVFLGISGCTLSPTTVNIHDPRYNPSDNGAALAAPMFNQEWLDQAKSLPPQDKLPELPHFSDVELENPDIVEQRLVGHIGKLREHILSYYDQIDDYEKSLLETIPQ